VGCDARLGDEGLKVMDPGGFGLIGAEFREGFGGVT